MQRPLPAATRSDRRELSGEGDLVITELGRVSGSLVLAGEHPGTFAIFDEGRRMFIAEVQVFGADRRISLRPGSYLIQKRYPTYLSVARVQVVAGAPVRVDYRGRVDRQVKIRGYRIELEEIEAVLNRHPELERAVVEVREDQPGDKRIVAFMVPRPQNRLGLVQLREQLRGQLPAHMIPSAFVEMESLPLTVNGKVDRAALRVATDSRASKVDLTSEFLAPRKTP